ncbi:MAG: 2-C-methyl-D-erythritol 4-phosphate cytidylyltransferase [Cytophagia bacterium]|nr:2-C-methyl-D-erythritol 4-phosphate cytidylyltransferase [Cytophagia bacterium]
MQKYAIIVAGGSGTRMKSDLPKQFIELLGKPILMHSIEAFHFDDIKIILVLPKAQIEFWKELMVKHQFKVPHQIVEGGKARFHSVKNGLESIDSTSGLVAIHDGVRPLIKQAIISESYASAEQHGNAIVSVGLKDSIRSVSDSGNKQEDRSKFRLIQTPQTFQLQLIKAAFKQPYDPIFTDDASVLERAGHKINLIDGDYQNIKITTPEDLTVAQSLLKA